jgi:predicted nucleic acid-binding protein
LAQLRQSGPRTSLFPNLLIGAHAAIAEHRLLIRDISRYRSYFPRVELSHQIF